MMRRLLTPLTLGAFMLTGAVAAHAGDLESLRANVPFAFTIGHTVLPAGDYTIRLDDENTPGVLRVSREDGRAGAFVMTDRTSVPSESGNEPKLVFSSDGNRYVLAQVLDPGEGIGVQVLGNPKANAEPEHVTAPTD